MLSKLPSKNFILSLITIVFSIGSVVILQFLPPVNSFSKNDTSLTFKDSVKNNFNTELEYLVGVTSSVQGQLEEINEVLKELENVKKENDKKFTILTNQQSKIKKQQQLINNN